MVTLLGRPSVLNLSGTVLASCVGKLVYQPCPHRLYAGPVEHHRDSEGTLIPASFDPQAIPKKDAKKSTPVATVYAIIWPGCIREAYQRTKTNRPRSARGTRTRRRRSACCLLPAYGVVGARRQPWRESQSRVGAEEAGTDQTYPVNTDQRQSPGYASAAAQYPPHKGHACDYQ